MEIMGAEQTEKSKKPKKGSEVSGRVPETKLEIDDQNPSPGGILTPDQIQAGRDEFARVHKKRKLKELKIKLNPRDPGEVTVFPKGSEKPKE